MITEHDMYEQLCAGHMKSEQQSIIDTIFAVRVANNMPWKRLMEIALRCAPEETKAALREINENDHAVAKLVEQLIK
jgi:hypothetical protein